MAIKLSNQTKKQLGLLSYKLLNDALSLWLLVFFVFLILEGLVPGYFSAYLSFTKIIIILFALLAGIAFMGRRIKADFDFEKIRPLQKNKTALAAIGISFILIVNSLKSLAVWEIAIVSVATLVIMILFYKIFILQEK